MNIHQQNQAMTLTELLVSTALISIVMVGVVSVDYAIRNSQQKISKSALTAMRTSATMLDIMKNAALATGDITNPGVLQVAQGVCIRQDVSDPNVYTDDTWVCYTSNPSANDVRKCNRTSSGPCPMNSTLLGTIISGGLSITLVQNNSPTAQSSYVDISITNRYDPALASDPLNNPEIKLTSWVYPVAHSF